MKGDGCVFSHGDFLKFPIVNHLLDYIEATYEFPLDDELRKRWPVVVVFQAWLSCQVRKYESIEDVRYLDGHFRPIECRMKKMLRPGL